MAGNRDKAMRFVPSGTKYSRLVSPFQAAMERSGVETTPLAGAGIGVNRRDPGGIAHPTSAKRYRFDNQALGETPPRDGPFAPAAAPVATRYPPRARVHQGRRKEGGLNPFRTDR